MSMHISMNAVPTMSRYFRKTYNSDKYETLHLAGHKRIFPYRVNAQERALMGGMRGVGFGALLGLDDSGKMHLPPDIMRICCKENIRTRDAFPVRGSSDHQQ